MCLSMSSPNGGVYGFDGPRCAGLVRRLNGAKIVGVVEDVWIPGHRDMTHTLGVIVDAGTNAENARAVAENGGFDERRRGLRPRLNWADSNHLGEVDRREQHGQRKWMYPPREREDLGR